MSEGQWFTRLASVVLLGGLLACQPQPERQAEQATAVDTAQVTAALDSLRAAFLDAYETGDVKTIASLWADEGITSGPGTPPVRGRDSIRALIERDPALGRATTQISPVDVRVLGHDWAYEMGVLTVRFTPEGTDEQQTVEISYLAMIHRTPDGWKYYREAYNLNQQPPEGM